jgi:hypothetical protein
MVLQFEGFFLFFGQQSERFQTAKNAKRLPKWKKKRKKKREAAALLHDFVT